MEGFGRSAFGVLVVVAVIGALIFALRPAERSALPQLAVSDAGVEAGAPLASSPLPAPSPLPVPGPTTALSIDPKRILEKPPVDRPKCAGVEFVDQWEGKSHTRGCIIQHADGGIVREGPWIMQDPEGWTSAGSFKDNMKEGRWTRWYPNGAVAEIEEWSADQRNGVQTRWDDSGARVLDRTWKDGLLDGLEEVFLSDGTMIRRMWKKGVEQK